LGDIRKIVNIQYDLIKKGSSLVKPDGILVYSTCTTEPEENFEIVKRFLTEHENFKLVSSKNLFPDELVDENGCIQTFPHRHNIDGSFAAKFVRIN